MTIGLHERLSHYGLPLRHTALCCVFQRYDINFHRRWWMGCRSSVGWSRCHTSTIVSSSLSCVTTKPTKQSRNGQKGLGEKISAYAQMNKICSTRIQSITGDYVVKREKMHGWGGGGARGTGQKWYRDVHKCSCKGRYFRSRSMDDTKYQDDLRQRWHLV